MGGVTEIRRLPDHVPADLWTLPDQQEGEDLTAGNGPVDRPKQHFHMSAPVGLRLLLHDTGAKEVDPELASHGGGRGVTGPS